MSAKFYKDKDKDIRNIEILTNLLTSIHYAKKYKNVGKLETSYQWCFEVFKNYARLLMSINGYITDKDILSLAVSMNKEIDELFKFINSDISLEEKIKEIIYVTEKFIDLNIEAISIPIIDYIRFKKEYCSIEDIKLSEDFKHIDGDLNFLLEALCLKIL